MGKKIIKMMDEMKEKFIEGCKKNNFDEKIVLQIWADWEAFAQYAFNKSHSTCYAYVSYQTAYLKANPIPDNVDPSLHVLTNLCQTLLSSNEFLYVD